MLFRSLNRRRDDFECEGGEVRSQKGVFRTHTIHDKRVLAAPLSEAQAEARLEAYYDPYYTAVKRHAGRLQERFTNVVIVDGHTGSPRRLEGHAIVLGTGRGKYCDPELAALAAEVLESHGFDCTLDLSGYRGGAVVRHFGTSRSPRQAIQVEVNAGLIMRCSRRAYAESLQQGLPPAYDREVLAELRAAMTELLRAIGQYVQA